VYAHLWTWAGSRIDYVEHGVFAYQTMAGNAVVAEVKVLVSSCKTYQ
jgi:hypothetical protein